MQCINVINLNKYNHGYKDRHNHWIKVYVSLLNGSYDFEKMHEIDKWRFVMFCMLQITTKKPVPLDKDWLVRKGVNQKHRPLTHTVKALSNAQLVEVINVTEDEEIRNETVTDPSPRIEKNRIDKIRKEREGDAIVVGCVSVPKPAYDDLCKGYGQGTINDYIDKINDYCAAKGTSYRDYAAAIRQWIRRDRDTGKFKYKDDKFEKMKRLMKQ